jgi:hypothetical protein
MSNVYPTFSAAKAAVQALGAGRSGFALGLLDQASAFGVVTSVTAPRAYHFAVAVEAAARGLEAGSTPSWFVYAVGGAVGLPGVEALEAAFAAVPAPQYAALFAYASSGFESPSFDTGVYVEWLVANGMPVEAGVEGAVIAGWLEAVAVEFLGS